MNFKYIGEAVALVGIAWAIMRWVVRNAAEADAGPTIHVGGAGRRARWTRPRDTDDTPAP